MYLTLDNLFKYFANFVYSLTISLSTHESQLTLVFHIRCINILPLIDTGNTNPNGAYTLEISLTISHLVLHSVENLGTHIFTYW